METLPEAPGVTPSYIMDPRIGDGSEGRGPLITAKFYMAPDPRTDPVDQPIIDSNGNIPLVELVDIFNANDPKNSPMTNVSTDIHRYKLFPKEYQAFRAGITHRLDGTPLTEWLGDNDRTRNLSSFHLHTVEQLAEISDSLCQTLGPGTYDLRKRAKAYVEAHKGTAVVERALAENDQLKTQLAEMQRTVERLAAAVGSANAKSGAEQDLDEVHPALAEPDLSQPKRRGRPPRIQEGEH